MPTFRTLLCSLNIVILSDFILADTVDKSRHMRLLRFPQGPFHTALVIKGCLSITPSPPPSPSHPV